MTGIFVMSIWTQCSRMCWFSYDYFDFYSPFFTTLCINFMAGTSSLLILIWGGGGICEDSFGYYLSLFSSYKPLWSNNNYSYFLKYQYQNACSFVARVDRLYSNAILCVFFLWKQTAPFKEGEKRLDIDCFSVYYWLPIKCSTLGNIRRFSTGIIIDMLY